MKTLSFSTAVCDRSTPRPSSLTATSPRPVPRRTALVQPPARVSPPAQPLPPLAASTQRSPQTPPPRPSAQSAPSVWSAVPPLMRLQYQLGDILQGDVAATIARLQDLAALAQKRSDWQTAIALYKQILEKQRSLYPSEHPALVASLVKLVELHHQNDDFAGAAPLYQQAVARWQSVAGDHRSEWTTALEHLADLVQPMPRVPAAQQSKSTWTGWDSVPDLPDPLLSNPVLAADGCFLIGSGVAGTLQIWEIKTRALLIQVDAQVGQIQNIYVHADSQLFSVVGVNGRLTIWTLVQGRPVLMYSGLICILD